MKIIIIIIIILILILIGVGGVVEIVKSTWVICWVREDIGMNNNNNNSCTSFNLI